MGITNAIIAGVATIVSALLTIFLKDWLDKRKENRKYRFIEVSSGISTNNQSIHRNRQYIKDQSYGQY